LHGASPFAIDLDGDGALKQRDGCDQTERVFELDDDAFYTGKGAALDTDFLAELEEWVGLDMLAEAQHGFDGEDFCGWDGFGTGTEADDAGDAGGFEYRHTMRGIEAAEDVAREEGDLEFLSAV
jgi:hypothetical protein